MIDPVRPCPYCGRMSERVAWKQSCPFCYRLAGPVDRIMYRHGVRIVTIALVGLVALALGVLIGEARADDTVRLTTIDTGSIKWTTGTIGDDTVNILENRAGDASWISGTIGDDSVNLLENRTVEDASRTTGTIGDTRVDILEFNLFDDETDED